MNKEELVKSMTDKASKELGTKLSLKEVNACLNAFISVVTEKTTKKEEVNLVGFGKFTTSKRAARVGRNPQTQEEIQIPATTVAKFVPGKSMLLAAKETPKATRKGSKK